MRGKMIFKLGLTLVIAIAVYIYFVLHVEIDSDQKDNDESTLNKDQITSKKSHGSEDAIHLSLVACGDRGPESLVVLKSAVIFTKTFMVFHIFAEDALHEFFNEQINSWPSDFKKKFMFNVYHLNFGAGNEGWKKLFKPCASQRIFLPSILKDVDSLLYVDTDVLFLQPLEDIWGFFSKFNSTQLIALSPEHEDPSAGWYNRFARHPYYGKLGVNSGVMLMNLTRLRSSKWVPSLTNFYEKYKLEIPWGDQDLINIYFHYYPEELYIYSCKWNYRADHCMYMSVCKAAETEGVAVLHGSRRYFHHDKQPIFRTIYQAFDKLDLEEVGMGLKSEFIEQLKEKLKNPTTECGKIPHVFLKQIELFVLK